MKTSNRKDSSGDGGNRAAFDIEKNARACCYQQSAENVGKDRMAPGNPGRPGGHDDGNEVGEDEMLDSDADQSDGIEAATDGNEPFRHWGNVTLRRLARKHEIVSRAPFENRIPQGLKSLSENWY